MYGKRLRGLRKKAKLSLEQVAEKLNTTHSTISRYENEKLGLETKSIIAFCKLYNVSSDYILGLTDDPRPLEEEE